MVQNRHEYLKKKSEFSPGLQAWLGLENLQAKALSPLRPDVGPGLAWPERAWLGGLEGLRPGHGHHYIGDLHQLSTPLVVPAVRDKGARNSPAPSNSKRRALSVLFPATPLASSRLQAAEFVPVPYLGPRLDHLLVHFSISAPPSVPPSLPAVI
ncbi:hypothetical protein B0H17DRAFT_1206353 [Mycena rosella]|uniref:Uncharacterized protein n=1 Tax=Mycena rosella TaxID=1033263 RepID=A0AAD7D5A3_MYCRO|nr:hypothetical protein B0H17DRAFT_1206353 [Mycena rosella]